MAAATGAGRLRRAASALLLRSPRLPARELSAPARLYHKKVWAGEGVREPSRGPAAVAQITSTEEPRGRLCPAAAVTPSVPRLTAQKGGSGLWIIMKTLGTWDPLTRHLKMLEPDWWGLRHVVTS
uniref:Iron-sulfur cluster assembly enzyme n=2 Tax=Mus musculus TaxID=10090 RepID=D6RE47_MOUSE